MAGAIFSWSESTFQANKRARKSRPAESLEGGPLGPLAARRVRPAVRARGAAGKRRARGFDTVFLNLHVGIFGTAMMKSFLATILTAILLCAGAAGAQAKITLVLGLYPSEKPRKMVWAFRPALNAVEDLMEQQLGEEVEIKMQILSDYFVALDELLAGRVDFARLGPVSYVLGKGQEPEIELLAMENDLGDTSFEGFIVVRDDSDVHDVTQLKGKSFAFVSERSTLGRFFPQVYLAKAGIKAADLKDYAYVGHHEAVGLAVWSGQYDAGALNSRMYNKLQSRGMKLRVIARYENVTRAWVARAALPADVKQSLREALIGLQDPKLLASLGFGGFLPGRDTSYDRTRQLIAEHAQDYQQYTPHPEVSPN